MASRKQLIVQTLVYLLYGVMILLLILYVTFPYDVLVKRFSEHLAPNFRLTAGRAWPGVTPGVTFQPLQLLGTTATPALPLLQIETLRLQPDLLALLSRRLDLRLEGGLYGGRASGNIRTSVLDSTVPWEVQTRLGDLRLEQYPFFQKDGAAFLRGRLGGEISAVLNGEGLLQQGTLNMQLEPLVLMANQGLPLPLLRDVTCDTVQSQLRLTVGQLQIVSFMCRGEDLMIQAKGIVRWQQPLAASTLELQLQLRSENTYKQEMELLGNLVRRRPTRGALSFSLRGTLQEPRPGV